ncbi:hypothetical protein GF351_06160 [Candidatus Woesearchaeota archaeon]|nr:hypothetical protein [Candidatus Woesearchaeota archaeon]
MDILSETKPEKSFILSDGKVIRSLKQLEQTLHLIDDEVFDNHVNVLKNDFYNWIKDVYGDKDLAGAVKDMRSKEQLAKALAKKLDNSISSSVADPFAIKSPRSSVVGSGSSPTELKPRPKTSVKMPASSWTSAAPRSSKKAGQKKASGSRARKKSARSQSQRSGKARRGSVKKAASASARRSKQLKPPKFDHSMLKKHDRSPGSKTSKKSASQEKAVKEPLVVPYVRSSLMEFVLGLVVGVLSGIVISMLV